LRARRAKSSGISGSSIFAPHVKLWLAPHH
jgi:hypothetical protein